MKDKIKGGLADKKKPSDFDQKALSKGQKVEMEHTSDKAVATEIAMDHLTEDPKYYDKLQRMEKSAFWNGFEKQAKELTTKARKSLSDSDFVFPHERKYPIHDFGHAQAAVARVMQHGTHSQQRTVKSAVKSRFPDHDWDF